MEKIIKINDVENKNIACGICLSYKNVKCIGLGFSYDKYEQVNSTLICEDCLLDLKSKIEDTIENRI